MVSKEEEERKEKRRLKRKARLSKDRANLNLKNNYVLLLYGLRYSIGKIRDEQKDLREKLKHNKELLLKAELE